MIFFNSPLINEIYQLTTLSIIVLIHPIHLLHFNLKKEYKFLTKGKKSKLTTEKVMKLVDVGFVFDARSIKQGSNLRQKLKLSNNNNSDSESENEDESVEFEEM